MVNLSLTEGLYAALLGLVVVERFVELLISKRNARLALEQGGIEVGQRHYKVMVLLHSVFLPACLIEVLALGRPFHLVIGLSMFLLVLCSMGLRYWAVTSLGTRWNTRVLVVPGLQAVTRGPYRWIRHPNYVAVVIEIFALPLVHGAWWTAASFTVLNFFLLKTRIRVEEEALKKHCGYQDSLGQRPRFLPESP
ncbi:MAG: isoprenylcysteine carboxyl methyltransferase family protein [Myxococcota bacterium]|nr:isoprenylcysteine carboxyl methyltransferase family protein [Myxococcota bacterium]